MAPGRVFPRRTVLGSITGAKAGLPLGKEIAIRSPIVTRRDFINGTLIGAAGLSAGALWGGVAHGAEPGGGSPARERGDPYQLCHKLAHGQQWPIPPASGKLYDCIVIGGGISGLAAAWQLRKLDRHDILVLEKNSEVGGFCRDERSGRQCYSVASSYTEYPDTRSLVALYTDLGVLSGADAGGRPVVADRYLPKSTESKDYVDRVWYDDAWDSGSDRLPLPKKCRDDFRAFRDDLQRWYGYVGTDGRDAFAKPTDRSTTDAAVRDLDRVTLKEYIAGKGWDAKVSEFFDPFIRSALGTTHDRVSAWAAVSFLSGEFGFVSDPNAPPNARQPVCVLTQPGGNGYLSRLLADRLGRDRLRTGAMVVQARNEGGQVQVTCLDGETPRTLRARTAIYAAPRYMATRLLPELTAEARAEAKAFRYAPYLVANVHVSRTPVPGMWNGLAHGDFFVTDFVVADWSGLADPGAASPARPNVLTVYAPLVAAGSRRELLTKPAEYYAQRVLGDLDRLLPSVRETVTGVDLYRWGHAMVIADKGFIFSAARRNAARPLGRLFFAHHDVDGVPAFENAVTSGIRAAQEADETIAG